jgi:hypothetical protein
VNAPTTRARPVLFRAVTTAPGPLVPADETFNHQITDTFARVGQTDRSWTEKVCAMACARDGSVQLAFGLGKYTNRGVMDGYAGVSRGVEQWVVRASRKLAPDPDTATIGPIRYEVLEPLRTIRFALDDNDASPVAFEWTFTGVVPPFLENREVHTSRDRYRLDADVVRFHHSGTAHGWVEIDGVRTELDDTAWVSTRDHSWGVRYQVGVPVEDLEPQEAPPGFAAYALWSPVVCARADGEPYALHFYFQRHGIGDWSRTTFEGGVEHPDGRREAFLSAVPDLRFRDDNRRLLGGTITCVMKDGTERVFGVEPVSDTGFHLGTGLYFGLDGHWHGEWRGPLHVEGEYFSDCSLPAVARRIHQHRDCVIRVTDETVGGAGVGNLQSIVTGPHPEIGLTEAASFV